MFLLPSFVAFFSTFTTFLVDVTSFRPRFFVYLRHFVALHLLTYETPEGLIKFMQHNNGNVFLMLDEFINFFVQMGGGKTGNKAASQNNFGMLLSVRVLRVVLHHDREFTAANHLSRYSESILPLLC